MSGLSTLALPSSHDLSTIHSCYLAFGQEKPLASESGLISALPHWRNSVMSPRIARTSDIDALIELAKEAYRAGSPAGPFEAKTPYFNLMLPEGCEPEQEWVAEASKRGLSMKKKSAVVLFEKPLSPRLPEGFHFSSGSPLHRQLKGMFLEVMADAFPKADRSQEELFWKEIYKGIRLSPGNTRVVIIQNSRGRPVAAGFVTASDKGAFLWCGGVKKRFQGRGLARPLMGIRQFVSQEDGCPHWLYSTGNPRIEKFGDKRFVDYAFHLTE